MKKVVKIVLVSILAVWAVFATAVIFMAAEEQIALEAENAKLKSAQTSGEAYEELQKKYDDLKEKSDALAKSWEEIQPGYQEYLKGKEQSILDSVDTLLFEGWADLVSEKNFVCAVDDETVMVVVYAEGRTIKEMTDVLQEKVSTYCVLLRSSDFTNSILAVVGDNDEVLFGYTVPSSGDPVAFLSENCVD